LAELEQQFIVIQLSEEWEMKIHCMFEQRKNILWSILQISLRAMFYINVYLVQIWDVDGGHVENCLIESRPFTGLLYYLHHHPAKQNINCISHRFHFIEDIARYIILIWLNIQEYDS
jgi:hypothetical protein